MLINRMDRIIDLVGSRRFCFVIMPYRSLGLLYEHLRKVIEDATGLRCIRADEVPGSGQPLLDKLHALIEAAELVIVELSEPSPNVYYEVGYAKALNKEVLVICREGTPIPTDLQGLERIEYVDTPGKLPQFDAQLRSHLVTMVDSEIQLLRAMLVAPAPSPSYVFSSPRWRVRNTEHLHEMQLEKRTYGDYIGVVGILYALGTLLGKECLPELLSAQHVDCDILNRDINLYLIGSPRSNTLTAEAMVRLQKNVSCPWRFEIDDSENSTTLAGMRNGRKWAWKNVHGVAVPEEDYGLILRGPHPDHPQNQMLILAGARSLGTGAACLAATRPRLIQKIRNRLMDVEIGNKSKIIWVLVAGRPDPDDNHVSEEYVSIEDAGIVE